MRDAANCGVRSRISTLDPELFRVARSNDLSEPHAAVHCSDSIVLSVSPTKHSGMPPADASTAMLPPADSSTTNHTNHVGGGEKQDEMAFCLLLLRKRVHYVPIFTFAFIVVSFFTSYGVAVYRGSVEPDFPYISHTAIYAPERCIFAQLVNMGAFFMAANVLVRYLQLKTELAAGYGGRRESQMNRACIVLGFLSALGLSLVANFQTDTTKEMHYTGAFLAFLLGLVYCWLQTTISIRMRRCRHVTALQIINSVLLTVFLTTFAISKTIFKVYEAQGRGTKLDTLRAVYLVSTITEWLTAVATVVFVLTFVPDFRKIILFGPRVEFRNSSQSDEEQPARQNGQAGIV